MNTKNALFLFVLAFIVVGLFISFVYLYGRNTGDNPQDVGVVEDSGEKSNEKQDNGDGKEGVQQDGLVFVEVIEEDPETFLNLPLVPDLDRPIIIPDSFNVEFKEKTTQKIEGLLTLLKQDSDLFNEWMDLGLLFKGIEDYEGARQAWEYASAIRPQNSLSFTNLGVLYGYYLKNPILAEKNYLKAIENSPKYIDLYIRASDFYLDVLQDKEKAVDALKSGLEELPEDESLREALKFLEN